MQEIAMSRLHWSQAVAAVLIAVGMASVALADPCGMVPPIYVQDNTSLVRVGDQQTYVFYKDGIETFVIRPGFSGKVEDFGMLISFPTPPELRKVSEDIFPQIAKAIDPPEVVIDLRATFLGRGFSGLALANGRANENESLKLKLKEDEVRVLREEAVGMYEVAVLEAGSAAALKRWMDDHKYKFPTGMEDACNDYIKLGWCFVAEKARVGGKANVDPKPGMKKVDTKLPAGSAFDGHVQAMAFRFKVDKLVLPMRLSAYNEGEMHNIVYLFTDGPRRIRSIPEEYVVRQLTGEELLRNVTQPLPLRIIGGTEKEIPDWQKQTLPQQRDPAPHNGQAKELFASDLLAVKLDRLSHPHEEDEKMLLRIGEHFGLRGPEIDKENLGALAKERDKAVKSALDDMKKMTLTVVDGDFPREVVAGQNLAFGEYRMPARRNSAEYYDAKTKQPGGKKEGVLKLGALDSKTTSKPKGAFSMMPTLLGTVALGLAAGVVLWRTRSRRAGAALLVLAALGVWLASPVVAQDKEKKASDKKLSEKEILALIDDLEDSKKADGAVKALVTAGEPAVPHLLGEAIEGKSVIKRGWAIVCLSEIGGKDVEKRLRELYSDTKQPSLVRTWAAAAVVYQAETTEELLALAPLIQQFPSLGRPIGMRLVDALAAKKEGASAEDMINVTIKVPQLQQALAPAIIAAGSDKLVTVMTKSKEVNTAQQAAAYLGTIGQKDRDGVAKAVIAAYKFDPKAKKVPWTTALWVPGINWEKDFGRQLVSNLISWHLWCDLNNQKPQQQQIQNNIQGVGLAQQVGYQPQFGNISTDQWLTTWGQLVGRKEIARMLKEQGADDKERFKKLLESIPEK
jgi:hypothetical protein